MATIYIDNKPYEAKEGENLLHTCLALGFNLPYFCWHPALHSVGACRQCAVKVFRDENDTKGKIVMSCMTAVRNGMRLSVDDEEAKLFRRSVIEFLMVNHPHDCPVCDEGGECHLQDMTVLTGHVYRTSRFNKRTHRNQYLGPFVNHEMNRCIACYRCVRFYNDYAGGGDLRVFAWHDAVYFGRSSDGVLESEFSGNLVEICPTGVFTDKTLGRHYTRKWDLQTAPSVCVHCSVGCNTLPGERYGMLRRIRNRYNRDVNGFFLCDRGRYGYEFVNSMRRIRTALFRPRAGEAAESLTAKAALEHAAKMLAEAHGIIGIGSPRASLETNFALRTLVGQDRFCMGLSRFQKALYDAAFALMKNSPARQASLHDVEQSDAVFILGEDLTNTAPMMAYAVRQAVQQRKYRIAEGLRIEPWDDAAVRIASPEELAPLFIVAPAATKLDDVAELAFHAPPGDIARLGYAVAHVLDAEAPPVEGMTETMIESARRIAHVLRDAKRPIVIAGVTCQSVAVIEAAATISRALCKGNAAASMALVMAECNSCGMGFLGGFSLHDAFESMMRGEADTLLIAENDLYRRTDSELIDALFSRARHVIAIDHLTSPTTDKASLVLPAAAFAEATGTMVNCEGRAQRFFKVFVPQGDIRESWRWLCDVARVVGRSEAARWRSFDDIVDALASRIEDLAPVREVAPGAAYRIADQKIPRQPHRYSGRTAMRANENVAEVPPLGDGDSPLAFSMEGYELPPPPPLIPRYWAPNWNSDQALNKYQMELAGVLHDGAVGKRLIEPPSFSTIAYDVTPPGPSAPREEEWSLIALHHIFGSEELSAAAGGIAHLAPAPYVALCPDDAQRLGLDETMEAKVIIGKSSYRLPVRLRAELPSGLAGIPSGIATPGLLESGHQWAALQKGSAHE